MAGSYIHIPFCKSKCNYCNFYSVASLELKADYINALLKEIELQKDYLKNEKVETIYFGGGTPSLLSSDEINKIINGIKKYFEIETNPEITLEVNPESLSKEKAKEISETLINRLSIGVQSLFDDDLKYIGRIHNAKQSLEAIKNAKEYGFKNLSIDLIYGIPTLTNEKWISNLEQMFLLEVPHISAYSLTAEPNTPLFNSIEKGKLNKIDEEKTAVQFEILMKLMSENNYVHYEISNFCKEGFYSKHNSSYWKQKKYLGIGASAHSYNEISRQWNVSDNKKYINSLKNNTIPFEKEILTENQKYNEYILTTMRTIWGTDADYIKNNFGEFYSGYFICQSDKFVKSEKMINKNNIFVLSNDGKIIADTIISSLFI
ncbi:MAG: radical SAM family heme chaperone HemW [Bacteroidales bacterium]|nr:radical SAM family heme chaperone HemW [Bacteroidales bacterium]